MNAFTIKCKAHQIPNRLAVDFVQSIEARGQVENEDVVWAALTDRRCYNYIWVINNFIAYGAPYITGLTVFHFFLNAYIDSCLVCYILNKDKEYKNETHWSLNEMANILQTTFSIAFCWIKKSHSLITIFLKFVSEGTFSNYSALIQVMAWHQQFAKPLTEAVMTNFFNAIWQHVLSLYYFNIYFHLLCPFSMHWYG